MAASEGSHRPLLLLWKRLARARSTTRPVRLSAPPWARARCVARSYASAANSSRATAWRSIGRKCPNLDRSDPRRARRFGQVDAGVHRSTARHRLPQGRRCRLLPPSGVQSERTNDVFESRWRPFSMSDIYNPLLFYVADSSRRPNKYRHLRKRLPMVLPSHILQPEVTLSEFAKWQKHFLWFWLPCLRSRSLRTLPVRMTYGAAKSPSAWPILTAPPQPPLAAIPWTVWPSSCGAGGRFPDAPRRRSRRLRYLWVWGRCSRPLADEPPLH